MDCTFRWTADNPFGGKWAHQCDLPADHDGEHVCHMDDDRGHQP